MRVAITTYLLDVQSGCWAAQVLPDIRFPGPSKTLTTLFNIRWNSKQNQRLSYGVSAFAHN